MQSASYSNIGTLTSSFSDVVIKLDGSRSFVTLSITDWLLYEFMIVKLIEVIKKIVPRIMVIFTSPLACPLPFRKPDNPPPDPPPPIPRAPPSDLCNKITPTKIMATARCRIRINELMVTSNAYLL